MRKLFLLSFLMDFIVNGLVANCWAGSLAVSGRPIQELATFAALMCLAVAVFELPTGYLADRFLGRKGSTLVGIGLNALSFLILALRADFQASSIAFIVNGIATTFISGARQAWFRDYVGKYHPERVKRLFFDIDLVGRAGTLSGVWVGSFVLTKSNQNFWLMACVLALVVLVLGSIMIPSAQQWHNAPSSTPNLTIRGMWQHQTLAILTILFLAAACFGIEDGTRTVIFQPLTIQVGGGSPMFLAYQSTIGLVPRLLGGLVGRRITTNHARYLMLSALGIAAIEAFLPLARDFVVFSVAWAGAVFLFGIFFPMSETILHEAIDAGLQRWRATIISIYSLVGNLAQALTAISIATLYRGYLGEWLFLGAAGMGACAVTYWLLMLAVQKRIIREKNGVTKYLAYETTRA